MQKLSKIAKKAAPYAVPVLAFGVASLAGAQTTDFTFDPAPIATQSKATMGTVATAAVSVVGLGIAIRLGFRWAKGLLKG